MSWFDEQDAYMQDPAAQPGAGTYAQPRTRTPVNTGGITANTVPGQTTMPVPYDAGGGQPQATGGGGTQPYSDAALKAILAKYPPNNDGVRQAYAEIQRTFGPGAVTLLDHPERLDKFQLADGRIIDTVMGAGGANPSWGWIDETHSPSNAHLTGGARAGAMGGGAAGAAQMGTLGSLLGDPMAGRSVTDDPGYKFRFDEGLKALERSAASRGTLLTGGMLKGLTRFGQDLASTEYQNSYARRASEQGNTFNRLYGVANMGLNAAGQAGAFGSSYGRDVSNNQLQSGNIAANQTREGANVWNGLVGNLANIGGQYFAGRQTGGVAPRADGVSWNDYYGGFS